MTWHSRRSDHCRVRWTSLLQIFLFLVPSQLLFVHHAVAGELRCFRPPYIVHMRGYAPMSVLEGMVRHLLLPFYPEEKSWRFISRENMATTRFPTDFVLVQFGNKMSELSVLQRARHIIYSVSVQEEHGRGLRALHRRQREDFEESEGAPPGFAALVKEAFGAGELWNQGIYGSGIRIAVFDTGLSEGNPHFANVVERTDWTEEATLDDHVGHGTFVAGLIGGSHPRCPGIAPGVNIYTFRVFTGAQVSYTSWFLDAFNYAMQIGIDVLNLSIGGPDFADQPFIDKVNELTASGIIVVSAIGNDGPLWGSLNNPADMMEVVGVGAVEPTGAISSFSSRGMTTHELSFPFPSYGRTKPDLVAYGRSLLGPSHVSAGACRRLSGTSVASPVVAGAIALIASMVPRSRRKFVVNPASIKRALIVSSRELPGSSIYEQGSGLLDLVAAAAVMKEIDNEFVASLARRSPKSFLCDQRSVLGPRQTELLKCTNSGTTLNASQREEFALVLGPAAITFPRKLDLRRSACPFMWPHCSQLLFPGGAALTLNVTILNPGGVKGEVESVHWIPGPGGSSLDIAVTKPERFWPWAGGLGLHIAARSDSRAMSTAEGNLRIRVRSVLEKTYSDVDVPIRVDITDAPPREKRLLWDTFHSLRYPPGYVPRDNLAEARDMLDWLGDHPHTNFHAFFRHLRHAGYYIDVLDRPINCLPDETSRVYGGLLLFDSEDFFSAYEIESLRKLVLQGGMALIVAGEWHNVDVMNAVRFEDDNTRSWWTPVIGGGNVPALNEVLSKFGIALGNVVVSGLVRTKSSSFRFESGNALVRFPKGGEVLYVTNLNVHNISEKAHSSPYASNGRRSGSTTLPLLGITKSGRGAVAVYGDTNCIDTAYKGSECHQFLYDVISHAISSCGLPKYDKLLSDSIILPKHLQAGSSELDAVASPLTSSQIRVLSPHSKVLLSYPGDKFTATRGVDSYCSSYYARLEKVGEAQKDAELAENVRFPSGQPAAPVGAVKNYYRPHIPRRSIHWSMQIFQRESTVSGRVDTSTHARPRMNPPNRGNPFLSQGSVFERRSLLSLWSAISGAVLIVLSSLLRFLSVRRNRAEAFESRTSRHRQKRNDPHLNDLDSSLSSLLSGTSSLSYSRLQSRANLRR